MSRNLFGDFVSGNLWALRRNGEAVEVESIGNVASLASFGEDRDGELYLVSLNGTLHRLEAADPGAAEPMATALSETGIFTDVESLSIAPGFIEYDLHVPFWSDGTDTSPGTASKKVPSI